MRLFNKVICLVGLLLLGNYSFGQSLSEPVVLTNKAGAADYWPGFLQDGKTVFFSRLEKGNRWKLYKVSMEGGEATVFWEGGVGATRASKSVSGRIAFTGLVPGQSPTLWITDTEGKNGHKIELNGQQGSPSYPSWYAGEKRLVMVDYQGEKGGNLIRVNVTSGKVETLTDPSVIRCGMPSVSPNGQAIVFAGQKPDGDKNYDQTKNSIWILKKDNSLSKLSPGQGRAPTWSPDGNWVAYESTEGSPDGNYAIFVISVDGKHNHRISSYEWDANHPVWSQDGKTLVVSVKTKESGKETRIALLKIPNLK